MKKELNDILMQVKSIIGDREDEEVISLLEDLTDSYIQSDVDVEALKTAYEEEKALLEQKIYETESSWKKKYMERFFNGETKEEIEPEKEPEIEVELTIDDLFK